MTFKSKRVFCTVFSLFSSLFRLPKKLFDGVTILTRSSPPPLLLLFLRNVSYGVRNSIIVVVDP